MLGSNLVRLLIDRGHEVSVLIHPSSRSVTLEGLRITRYQGDILKPASLSSAVAGNDAVIHAAASTKIWPSRSELVRRINIDGTRNMIESAMECNIKRMIYVGSGVSSNVNGVSDGKYAFPSARYGLDYVDSKYEALQLVLGAVKTRGLPALAILPTFMIGPYDSLPGSGRIILAMAQGKVKFHTNGVKTSSTSEMWLHCFLLHFSCAERVERNRRCNNTWTDFVCTHPGFRDYLDCFFNTCSPCPDQ